MSNAPAAPWGLGTLALQAHRSRGRHGPVRRACALWAARLPGLEDALPGPCTRWAPSWMHAKATVGLGCPVVRWAVQSAAPVHLLVALGQQLLWLDSIALKVPLLLHCQGVQGCQGVAVAGLLASTDRTALLGQGSDCHSGFPGVLVAALTVLAQPPHFAIGATCDV